MSRLVSLFAAVLLCACPASETEKKDSPSEPAEPETKAEPAEPETKAAPESPKGPDLSFLRRGKRAEDADVHCDGKLAYESDSLNPPAGSGCDAIRTNDTMVDPKTGEAHDSESVYWCCPAPEGDAAAPPQ